MDNDRMYELLEKRINIMDLTSNYLDDKDKVDTRAAKRFLKNKDITDLLDAIEEARRHPGIADLLLSNLEDIYNSIHRHYYADEAIETETPANEFYALDRLQDVKDSDEYKQKYDTINESFKEKTGTTYEEFKDEHKEEVDAYDAAKTENIYYTSIASGKLKNKIEEEKNGDLKDIYKKMYDEVDRITKSITDNHTFEEIENIKNNIDTKTIDTTIETLIASKNATGEDISVRYEDIMITTEDCNNVVDMYVKYNDQVKKYYNEKYNKITRFMHEVDSQVDISDLSREELNEAKDLRRAKYMFDFNRKDYNNEDDYNENEYSEILNKNKKLEKIITKVVNPNDSKEMYEWLQDMIPYVNIHSVTFAGEDKLDEYIVNVFDGMGYGINNIDIVDEDSYYKSLISRNLNELKGNHFFVSEYYKTRDDNERYASRVLKDKAKLNYYEDLMEENRVKLGYVTRSLEVYKAGKEEVEKSYASSKEKIQKELEEIDKKIDQISDFTFSKEYKTEEKEALDAYEKATDNPTKDNISDMFIYADRLHDPNYKEKILINAFQLLDYVKEKELLTKQEIRSIEAYNKLTQIKRKDKDGILKKQQYLKKQLTKIDGYKEEELAKLDKTITELEIEQLKYQRIHDRYIEKLEETKNSLRDRGYIEQEKEESPIDFSYEKEKMKLFDRIRNLFKKNKEDGIETQKINLEDESLKDFVPIRKVKKIKKKLYEKINSSGMKEVIKKVCKELKDNAKEYIFASLFVTGIGLLIAQAIKTSDVKIPTKEDLDITPEKVVFDTEVETNEDITEDKELKQVFEDNDVVLEESTISDIEMPFNEIAQQAIDKTLTGENTVYTSVDKAIENKEGIDTNKLYKPSWENAEVGSYYTYEDGKITKVSEEEAEQLYKEGKNVVVSAENNNIDIGFTNIK